MIDSLILLTLQEKTYTMYALRKKINSDFAYFAKVSLGSLHPILTKLEESNFVLAERSISKGGQRSSKYSITNEGIEYFNKLILEEIPEKPSNAMEIINIKLLAFSLVNDETKKELNKNILNFLEVQKLKNQKTLETNKNKHLEKIIKFEILSIENKIQFISNYS